MFCVLQFLLPLVFSYESVLRDFPTNPDQYLTDDNANYKDNNYYANKQFFRTTKTLTNCLLSMYSCSFISIVAENHKTENVGIVRIIINNDMIASLTGNIEIQNCKFIQNKGGDIHIECSSSKYFNIYNCKFIKSEADNGGAGVHFAATNGKIENCHFLNPETAHEGGHIYFNPPNSNSNDVIFIVTNNLFEMDNDYYYGCIYLEKDKEMELTNNQMNYIKNIEQYFHIFFTKSQTVNFQNWNINNNFVFPLHSDYLVNTDTNVEVTLPENAFKE